MPTTSRDAVSLWASDRSVWVTGHRGTCQAPPHPSKDNHMRGGTLSTIVMVLVGLAALIFIVQAL